MGKVVKPNFFIIRFILLCILKKRSHSDNTMSDWQVSLFYHTMAKKRSPSRH
ncbi:hypothetical protein AAEJ74_27935 [Limnospira fusiformis PMC 851.14]|uniref:Uncharacterized protein n=1 Tax=Limnospira fusiformis PMC 851.14 TaxID=2219512 RepID=A0ABU9ETP3_LIMFS